MSTSISSSKSSKSITILETKKGRLAANRNERGEWQIDPAELARVYPKKEKSTVRQTQRLTVEEADKIKLLEEKVKLLEQVVSGLQEDKKAARADMLQWQGLAAHLSEQLKQLPAPHNEEGGAIIDADQPPAQKAAGGQRGGFWSFFWPWF